MRILTVAIGVAVGISSSAGPVIRAAQPAPDGVRGLWVQRGSLTSPDAIARLVRTARDGGFNTLLVQVRGRGEAFYASDLEPRAADLDTQPDGFDPLADVIRHAHAANLKVHAWVNVNLVASGTTLPRSRLHVAMRHPEWLMVPRALARTLRETDLRSPGYLGALSRWTRSNNATVEGLFLSPLIPAAQEHTIAVVSELVTRYAVDGLHLDYIRFPNPDFDYSPAALAEFRASQLPVTTPGDRDRFDRAAVSDPTAWTSVRPAAWATFRRDRLSSLVARITATARETRPAMVISAAVVPSPSDARDLKFQDWRAWAAARRLDALCPMLYTTEADVFVAQTTEAVAAAASTPVWAGIGAYRLPVARTADHIRAARRAGAAGVVVFSYDNLVTTTATNDYFSSLRPVLLEGAVAGVNAR